MGLRIPLFQMALSGPAVNSVTRLRHGGIHLTAALKDLKNALRKPELLVPGLSVPGRARSGKLVRWMDPTLQQKRRAWGGVLTDGHNLVQARTARSLPSRVISTVHGFAQRAESILSARDGW